MWTTFSFRWVVLTWKLEQKLKKLAVIDQVLAIGGQLLQKWLVLLNFYFIHGTCDMVWSIDTFNISGNMVPGEAAGVDNK